MSLSMAAGILAVGLTLYLGAAALISTFCLLLSPLPLLVFSTYPYMKRFTILAHFGVGLGLAMAPLGGWFAITQSFENPFPIVLLSLFTLSWVAGFDVIYSTLDELFDRETNLYSFSSRFGKAKALKISGYLHAVSFLILGMLFVIHIRALAALPLLGLSGYLLYLEHKKAEDVELAFFRINAILGFCVFGMVVVGVYFP